MKTGKRIARYLIELLVVFAGVYGAFMLNQHQEEKKLRVIKYNYYQGFLSEVTGINRMTAQLKVRVDSILHYYETEIEAGKRPQLKVHALDFTTNMFILRSAFDSDHFSSVGSGYVANISSGSNLISLLDRKVNNYQQHSMSMLYSLPYDTNRFYDGQGRLKPEFQWYMTDLKEISHYLGYLIIQIEQGAIPATKKLIASIPIRE